MKRIECRQLFEDMRLVLLNIILLLFVLIYSGQNFSIDSYGILLDKQTHITAFIGSLRWFGAILYDIYYFIFRHNPIVDSTMDCIIFIAAIAIVITLLTKKLCKCLNINSFVSILIIDLACVISVINAWFCDILSFPECIFISAAGFVLCFASVAVFIEASRLWQYIVSGLLLILSTGIYQQFICIFTIYAIGVCAVRIINEHRSSVSGLISIYIKPVVLILSSGILYFFIGKAIQYIYDISPNSRIALNISSIIENCIYYANNQHSYLKGRGYFSSEILTVCFLLLGFLSAVLLLAEWIKNRNNIKTVLIGLSLVFAYCSAYLPGILSTSHSHRAMFALFSVFLLFTVVIVVLSDNKIIRSVLLLTLIVVLCSNVFVSVKCEIALKKQNDADKLWCEQIIQELEEYERTGQQVENIYFCYDSNTDVAEYTQSAVTQKYSLSAMINLFADRDLVLKEMSEQDKTEYFSGKEWSSINTEEQIVFVGDAMYLCCY